MSIFSSSLSNRSRIVSLSSCRSSMSSLFCSMHCLSSPTRAVKSRKLLSMFVHFSSIILQMLAVYVCMPYITCANFHSMICRMLLLSSGPGFASMSMHISRCTVHNHCATACAVRSTQSVNSSLTASHSLCVLLSSLRCHCFVDFSKNNEQNLPIFAPQSDGILSMMPAQSFHRSNKSN